MGFFLQDSIDNKIPSLMFHYVVPIQSGTPSKMTSLSISLERIQPVPTQKKKNLWK